MAKISKTPTKSEIYRMFPDFSKKQLRGFINDVIRENRKIADNVEIRFNQLTAKEFDMLKEIMGEPDVD